METEGRAKQQTDERANERTNERASERTNERKSERTSERAIAILRAKGFENRPGYGNAGGLVAF